MIEDIHITKKMKKLEQNLIAIVGENRDNNLEDGIPNKQINNLKIEISRIILVELSRVESS